MGGRSIRLNLFCTPDWYQGFIPVFCHCWTRIYPQYPVDIAVIGPLDAGVKSILQRMRGVQVRTCGDNDYSRSDGVVVTEGVFSDIPHLVSTANLSRFLNFRNEPDDGIDGYFITDIDFLYFDSGEDVIQWHQKKMMEIGTCYYAHHGPWKRPNRFPGKSWHGEYERLAGGAVYLSGEWMRKTYQIREKYLALLMQGNIGTYREEDEVILCRICREAGLPINQDKNYPANFRGIHLGDFRGGMKHRWTDTEKMRRILTDDNCRRYLDMIETDGTWDSLVSQVCVIYPEIRQIFDNLQQYLRDRGFNRLQ